MTESNSSAKKTKTNNNYVRTFRDGAVAANIFRRPAPGGFEYLDFSISRAWKTANGKEGYEWKESQSYGRDDCLVLARLAELTAVWIYRHQATASAEAA
jgi:hypothetical protein